MNLCKRKHPDLFAIVCGVKSEIQKEDPEKARISSPSLRVLWGEGKKHPNQQGIPGEENKRREILRSGENQIGANVRENWFWARGAPPRSSWRQLHSSYIRIIPRCNVDMPPHT